MNAELKQDLAKCNALMDQVRVNSLPTLCSLAFMSPDFEAFRHLHTTYAEGGGSGSVKCLQSITLETIATTRQSRQYANARDEIFQMHIHFLNCRSPVRSMSGKMLKVRRSAGWTIRNLVQGISRHNLNQHGAGLITELCLFQNKTNEKVGQYR